MKILFTLLFTTLMAQADDVPLFWNKSPSAGVTNYVLSGNSVSAAGTSTVKINAGTNLTWTVTNLAAGTWTFSLKAQAAGLESVSGNVLTVIIVQLPPLPPTDLRRAP